MVDLKKLRDLVKLMVDNDLTELDLQGEGESVKLKRGTGEKVMTYAPAPMPMMPAAQPVAAPAAPAAAPAADPGLTAIRSPMVGTFYASPSPDAPPFVTVGSQVGPETVVCLIEAMKVFNEIKAELSGTIEKVLVESGQAVEFDQPLFLVRVK
ncbi:MAG: acetyl-CoA carboxylase biotin carboxyl carrier protein [Phycisphaeraceae bacterium]|nr:acetyl-CoA carboxylase biotin carboxyl carrier protein [Phycisphaeraceae bacterium]